MPVEHLHEALLQKELQSKTSIFGFPVGITRIRYLHKICNWMRNVLGKTQRVLPRFTFRARMDLWHTAFPLHHVKNLKCGLEGREPKGRLLLLSHPATPSPTWCHLWLLPTWQFLVSCWAWGHWWWSAFIICHSTRCNCIKARCAVGMFTHDLKQSTPVCALVYVVKWADDLVWHTAPWAVAEKSLQCIPSPVCHFPGSAYKRDMRKLNSAYFNIV